MFQLLPREQALIVFVLAATLLGFTVKHWRDTHRPPPPPPPVSRAVEPSLAGKRPGR